jgi:hypothetical protein
MVQARGRGRVTRRGEESGMGWDGMGWELTENTEGDEGYGEEVVL